MTKEQLLEKANDLPLAPGVYLMMDASGKVIYVGKAKKLKNRVSQYFQLGTGHNEKTRRMVSQVDHFDTIFVSSEFEALILENSLIKQHQPHYNILLKDDKGYSYIRVTREDWPRLSFTLQKEEDGAEYIGPYTSSFAARQMAETAMDAFLLPRCSKRFPQEIGKGRPCLNAHIGKCMAVCSGKISCETYNQAVKNAVHLIRYGKKDILKTLNERMQEASDRLEFETAALLRDQINAITKLTAGQKVVVDPDVEMDVVALAQYGINYAVASLGTSTTADHIQLLFRATNNVICCYDGDRAGRDAAWRALETALPYMTDGRQLRFMFLPDGEDPDTLVRKEGKEAFEARMEQAMPLSAFLFNSLMPQVDLSTPDGRARLSTLALPLISQVPGETLRIYLRQELGNKLGILDDSQLERLMPKAAESGVSRPVPQLKRTTMRILIGLLVQNPELATLVPPLENLDENKLPGLGLFRELVNTCLSQPGLTTGQLLEHYRGTNNAATLEKLSMWDDIADRNIAEQTFTDSLNHMFDSMLELRQEELIARERTHGLSSEERRELWPLNQELAKK